MPADYDARRQPSGESELGAETALRGVTSAHTRAGSEDIDAEDDGDAIDLPGAHLSDETLTMRALPQQTDEFTCTCCFLVHHRSQLAAHHRGQPRCRDCA